MNIGLKKFIISFLATVIFYVLIYFLITLYDQTGQTIGWVYNNLYYLIFLSISIVGGLTLYGNNDNKSKVIISIIFLINFIYLVFLFGLSNIGLNQLQGIFLIGFLLLGLVSTNLKNRLGGVIIILCILGISVTIFSVLIPLYEKGPDISGFENNFKTQFIVYSKASLNNKMAILEKDKKEYTISNGLSTHEFKLGKTGSQIIFKSDKQYQNSFGYILFSNKDILQIHPQSAININKDREIEIITGMIKYYPQNTKSFNFTGEILPSIMVDQENIDIIIKRHDEQIKDHIIQQLGGKQYKNRTLLIISKKTLDLLSFILPNQFEKNLQNFEAFNKYLNFDIGLKNNIQTFDDNKIKKGIIKDIKDGLKSTTQ